jgi:hypothetical protein
VNPLYKLAYVDPAEIVALYRSGHTLKELDAVTNLLLDS